jgi:hypothetical protein
MRDAEDFRRLYLRLSRVYRRVAELAEQRCERQRALGNDQEMMIEWGHAEHARKASARARSLGES